MHHRIVITGAGGQVGSFLARRAAAAGWDVLALTSAQWDITEVAAEHPVRSGDVVVNCAAYTNVDAAESDPDTAFAVNAAGAERVAVVCAGVGARLIHLSTDYVFSGEFGAASDGIVPRPYEPDDRTDPLSVYGRSKLAGETAVLAASPDAIVVRTAWVYTGSMRSGGSDFVATMRKLAQAGNGVAVVDDQIGSPTYVADLTGALLQVADGGVSGRILHAANRGAVSRYEQARAVFAAVGTDPALVRPVSSAENRRPAVRPRYSALSGVDSARAGLALLRDWRDALAEALSEATPDAPDNL